MTIQFNEFVIVNNIIFFKFSFYFTYITQSLNVEIFQSYKQVYENVIKRVVRDNDIKFDRIEFLVIL